MITELFSSNSLCTYNHDEPTLLDVVVIVLCAMISMLLMLVCKGWMKDDQESCQVPTSIPADIGDTASIDRHATRTITDLPQFKSITPFILYSIRPTTANRIMIDLLETAEETRIFSIMPKMSALMVDFISIQIALVQPSYTLLAVIEYFSTAAIEVAFFNFLRQLFSVIFRVSNTIQTWGDSREQLSPWIQRGLVSKEQLKRSHCINIQRKFKTWYNQTFSHHQQCHQRLDYDYSDGRLCSCSHRPLKSSTGQWSLVKGMAYTFHEYLYNDTFSLNKCLAITKLAIVIEQKWTAEQVKNLIERDRNALQVND